MGILKERLSTLRSVDGLERIAKELTDGVEKLDIDPPEIANKSLKELLRTIRDVLKTDPRVKLAYVFGSWVEGRATDRSDVDVAIYVGDRLGWRDYIALKHKLEDATGRPVDLVILNDAPPALAYRAIAQGKPILVADESLMADVETRITHEWLDLKPRLEAYLEAVIRQLRASR